MSKATAIVTRVRHRMFLRRYIKLHPGAPDSWTCDGGWHEAKVAIGDIAGGVARGSAAEKKLTPPRLDERWPLKCDGCDYEFTNRDRYQFFAVPISELGA